MTKEFLEFSASRGNDLSTPHPEFEFPGLKPGDRWCLCAARWAEAYQHGMAPRVMLKSTHARAVLDAADLWCRTFAPSASPPLRESKYAADDMN